MAAKGRREFKVRDTSTRLAKHASGRSSIDVPKGISLWRPPKEGSKTIDIIPFKCTKVHLTFPERLQFAAPGEWYGERTYFGHGSVGVNPEMYTCPAKTFDRPCPICEDMRELSNSPDKRDQDKIKKFKPKDRQIFLIYDHDQKEKGVQLWEIAYWNFGKQLEKFTDGAPAKYKDKYKCYYHPYEGYTMRITASQESMGEGMKPNTIYSVHAFYPRDSDLPEELFDHGVDLDAVVQCLDYKDLNRVYRGEVDVDDDEEDERDTPSDKESLNDDLKTDEDDKNDEEEDERKEQEEEQPAPKKKNEAAKTSPPPPPPEKEEEVKFGPKDKVSFMFFDRKCEGVIESCNFEKETADVSVAGQKRPVTIGFDEMALIESDTTFDQKPSKGEEKPKSNRTSDWDNSEPDETTKAPKKKGDKK